MKKVYSFLVLTISIINIIFTIIGYIISITPVTYMGEAVNIIMLEVIVLLFQIINIVLIKRILKEKVRNEKFLMVIITTIIIATVFIPVKAKSWTRYTYPKNNDTNYSEINSNKYVNGRENRNKKFDPKNFGNTVRTTEYKNIYGITIITDRHTDLGIEIN